MKTLYVQTNTGNWELKWQGGEKASSVHPTKQKAIEVAKILAKNNATITNPVSLKIKKADGTIETEYTYPKSVDPFPPKG